VASSAVIPVFGFPEWDYTFLDEVLLYPGTFDSKYTINSKEETITGMVGSGTMEGKMILSKPSLHSGFEITTTNKTLASMNSFTSSTRRTEALMAFHPFLTIRLMLFPG
jgi:MtfA peptidase